MHIHRTCPTRRYVKSYISHMTYSDYKRLHRITHKWSNTQETPLDLGSGPMC